MELAWSWSLVTSLQMESKFTRIVHWPSWLCKLYAHVSCITKLAAKAYAMDFTIFPNNTY